MAHQDYRCMRSLTPLLTLGAAMSAGAAPHDTQVLPTVEVIGAASRLPEIAGAATIIGQDELRQRRVFTVNEALRKAPGVHVRDAEGFGLRPNIGLRGLNPTRSTKVRLLEDGLPLAYAPYRDNASYYHPPIERFDSVEVLKGSEQILFGPQTIGGVINYVTPPPPQDLRGGLVLGGGSRDYFNGHQIQPQRWGLARPGLTGHVPRARLGLPLLLARVRAAAIAARSLSVAAMSTVYSARSSSMQCTTTP